MRGTGRGYPGGGGGVAPKGIGPPAPPPATKNGGLAGRAFTIKAYKNRGFRCLDSLPAISLRGLEGRSTRDNPGHANGLHCAPDTHTAFLCMPTHIIRWAVGNRAVQRIVGT